MQRGSLTVHVIPFLPQALYDELLWACDLNFVRGEDSFVRAQWACKPLVWQAYPQADAAHLVKLDAFLDRYLSGLPPAAARSGRAFNLAWNEQGDAAAGWPGFADALPDLTRHADDWAEELTGLGDLATNLEKFVSGILA